jgi:carbohydrate-selective porin OprB
MDVKSNGAASAVHTPARCVHFGTQDYVVGRSEGAGGAKEGAAYEDRINFAADVDFEKLIGLKQLTFHANVFQIDGGGLSRGALLNFLVVSGIEALPTTRLYEIWFEQKWGTKIALRAGQLAADTEFMTAKYTDVFTNASLGWPAGFALNMPSGGPSVPLAAMGDAAEGRRHGQSDAYRRGVRRRRCGTGTG